MIGSVHCNENPAFPEKELRGLSPNFLIHVSVRDLYIPRIGPHIFLQQNRQTEPENIYINRSPANECWNSFSGNICFELFVIVSLQCRELKKRWLAG
jgi:hypothetical protein